MVGKTFKGMTDDTAALADRALPGAGDRADRGPRRPRAARAGRRDRASTVCRHHALPGRVALRFARVRRYREDKSPAEADTIEHVQALLR